MFDILAVSSKEPLYKCANRPHAPKKIAVKIITRIKKGLDPIVPGMHVTHRLYLSRVSNIESDNSQNVGLEDYNNISDGIFPYFTTPSIKITLG